MPQKVRKPKFRKGQVVMWKNIHTFRSQGPTQIRKRIQTIDGKWRYEVRLAFAPNGFPEDRFRKVTRREANL